MNVILRWDRYAASRMAIDYDAAVLSWRTIEPIHFNIGTNIKMAEIKLGIDALDDSFSDAAVRATYALNSAKVGNDPEANRLIANVLREHINFLDVIEPYLLDQ